MMNLEPESNGTILVVDDLPETISLVRTALEEWDYAVLVATSGAEALQRAAFTTPDLILLDLLMPGMDGYEVCKQLKAQAVTQQIPVIFMTVITSTFDKVKGFQLGAVDYLTKPIDVEELLARVKTHLTIARLQQELQAANAHLEQQVAARTAELRTANTQLQRELAERQQAEEALRRLNRELRALSTCNQVLIRATDEQMLLHDICRIVCEEAGYRMAWVGYAENDDAKTVRPLAWAGGEDGYLRQANILWADTECGRGPAGTAIRQGEIVYVQEVATDPCMTPWREHALQRGYHSTIALPLKDEQTTPFGALIIYAAVPGAFNSDEIRLLAELAGDLAFGIIALRTRAERKRAEAALQRERNLIANIMETSPIGITTVDVVGQITFANTQAIKILGLTKAEIVQRTYNSPGWRITDFAGNPFPTEELPFTRVMTTGQAVDDVQHAIEWPDGRRVLLSINAAPLKNEAGQIEGMVAVLVDITERKLAETEIRKLSQAVEQSPEAIVITDTVGTIQYVNPRFTDMTGYLPNDALGKNPRILKSGETSIEAYQQLWNTITHGRVWRGEFHNKKKNNDLYWESVSISPVMDSQGNITHFVAVKEDITARKRAEEALRLLNEELELRVSQRTAELEAANKELQEFAYIVSHDLKAPLRGIGQLTQWLQTDYANKLDAEGQEQLELLGEQVEQMTALIDGILRYSRVVFGSESEEYVDLRLLLPQIIHTLMPPLHIAIQIDEALPIIQGDRIKITQVFQNLIGNAVKFLDKPTGMIRVACQDLGDRWLFLVEDNGQGIEPRYHERIFKIFQSCAPRKNQDSTGIGLTVVKKIIEFYGGRIWVESEPGQWSRFSFTWLKRTGNKPLR